MVAIGFRVGLLVPSAELLGLGNFRRYMESLVRGFTKRSAGLNVISRDTRRGPAAPAASHYPRSRRCPHNYPRCALFPSTPSTLSAGQRYTPQTSAINVLASFRKLKLFTAQQRGPKNKTINHQNRHHSDFDALTVERSFGSAVSSYFV